MPATEPAVADAEAATSAPPIDANYPRTALGPGIQWRVFLRLALPFATLAGFVSSLFPPVVLLVLPLNFRRVLSQYRAFHSGPLASGIGARLGAAMALLSFVFFIPFFVLSVYLGRESLIARIRDMATQNPDPQMQQALLWWTTKAGFFVFSGLVLLFLLLLFLFVGVLSGALMTGDTKKRP